MRTRTLFSFAIMLVLVAAGMLRAQSATGQITGAVKDATGAVVPNAKVTLTNQQTGLSKETRTNETGTYTFPLLAVGMYSVTAEQQGFRAAKRSDINLNVDQVARIDLELVVGATTDTINVEATAVIV